MFGNFLILFPYESLYLFPSFTVLPLVLGTRYSFDRLTMTIDCFKVSTREVQSCHFRPIQFAIKIFVYLSSTSFLLTSVVHIVLLLLTIIIHIRCIASFILLLEMVAVFNRLSDATRLFE